MKLLLTRVLLLLVCLSIQLRSARAQQDVTIRDNEMTLLKFAELEYPKLASQALIQGIVVVRVKLDDSGGVASDEALSGAGVLTPACLDNAKEWRFKPNASRAAVIVYNFRVNGTALKPGCNNFVVEPPNFATITTCAHEIQ